MEFYAATKDGIFIYDFLSLDKKEKQGWRDWSKGEAADDLTVRMVAAIPSPGSAFCHQWSANGNLLASVVDTGVQIFDATQEYKSVLEIPRVQADIEGRVGGVRNLRFSPQNSFMTCYEKWEPGLDNVHVWDIRAGQGPTRLHDCLLQAYSSGPLPVEMCKWTFDESTLLQFVPGRGIRVREPDFGDDEQGPEKWVPDQGAAGFEISPTAVNGACYVSIYIPENDGRLARVKIYHLGDLSKPTAEINMPAKTKSVSMLWNHDGTAMLALGSSDVDESGSSYFGTTYLYWVRADGKKKDQIYGAKDGLVQDLSWSPTKNEFMVIVGHLPATVRLHDGSTGKESSTLGVSRRNTICWNPFGRFCAVGGFGTLPGDMDFFDRTAGETISSLRAALTVDCSWSPDGQHFLSATVCPRMNEGNQISIIKYTGEQLLHVDYAPEVIQARHEDTGAGARTKTQALLYKAAWRPGQEIHYEDHPAEPKKGRTKGIPEGEAANKGGGGAWKPKAGDAGGSLISAMMRGEVADAPQQKWGDSDFAKPLEEWEIKKMERERKKAEEAKVQNDKDAAKQQIKDIEKGDKDNKKLLKELKIQLQGLEALKDKEWDELTDEDEAMLETEMDLIQQIGELEKKCAD